MRIALVQFDPVVGDIHGNAARASKKVRAAAAEGASLIVLPELALCGYPPRDLLLRQGIAQACHEAALQIARVAPECAVVLGLPAVSVNGGRPLANSLVVLEGGEITHRYDKQLLPTYDVFDESRYFTPGQRVLCFQSRATNSMRVGLLICEDLWQAHDVTANATYGTSPLSNLMTEAHPQVIVVPSASPFVRGKHQRHLQLLAEAARAAGVPVVSVNQLGGFDDLIFDGDARVVWPDGRCRAADRWSEAGITVDLGEELPAPAQQQQAPPPDPMEELWRALVCGTRAYVQRTGHGGAIVGISGGIDSALVCALAVAALGSPNVLGVLMPSKWSSAGSVDDAHDLAQRLEIGTLTLSIEGSHELLAGSLDAALQAKGPLGSAGLVPVADENLQSRLRGLHVMAVSNSTGALVLSTGNKSEYAAGYTTLYGDMCGGLAPIGDVLKTDVWKLATWVNANHQRAGFARPPIPQQSVEKVPSAELRPNQTDQDTLPPYHELDAIVRHWVEEECSVQEVAQRSGLPLATVTQWTQAIDRAEFKRDQAPIILKVTARAFGRGRPMPLAQRWRPS